MKGREKVSLPLQAECILSCTRVDGSVKETTNTHALIDLCITWNIDIIDDAINP